MTEDQIRRILWRCIWMSRGSAPVDRDYNYWIPMWAALEAHGLEIHHPNYAEDRVLGWEAEGEDAAAFGDYATPPSPYHAVPPYPGDEGQVDPPSPPPSTPPLADAVVLARLDALEAQIADVKGLILAIAQRPGPTYVGQVAIPKWLGTGLVTLTPKDAA